MHGEDAEDLDGAPDQRWKKETFFVAAMAGALLVVWNPWEAHVDLQQPEGALAAIVAVVLSALGLVKSLRRDGGPGAGRRLGWIGAGIGGGALAFLVLLGVPVVRWFAPLAERVEGVLSVSDMVELFFFTIPAAVISFGVWLLLGSRRR